MRARLRPRLQAKIYRCRAVPRCCGCKHSGPRSSQPLYSFVYPPHGGSRNLEHARGFEWFQSDVCAECVCSLEAPFGTAEFSGGGAKPQRRGASQSTPDETAASGGSETASASTSAPAAAAPGAVISGVEGSGERRASTSSQASATASPPLLQPTMLAYCFQLRSCVSQSVSRTPSV